MDTDDYDLDSLIRNFVLDVNATVFAPSLATSAGRNWRRGWESNSFELKYLRRKESFPNKLLQELDSDAIVNFYETPSNEDIEEYIASEGAIQQNINDAIRNQLLENDPHFPEEIIVEIQLFASMSYAKHHIMPFKLLESEITDEEQIQKALAENKHLYRFGDIVKIGKFHGYHFIGEDDDDQLKIIPNPSHESEICLLTVPREISDKMPDVVRFYRMNEQNMNILAHDVCPTKRLEESLLLFISFSSNHPFIRKTLHLQPNEVLPKSYQFYLGSLSYVESTCGTFYWDIFDGTLLRSMPLSDLNSCPGGSSTLNRKLLSFARNVKAYGDTCSFFIYTDHTVKASRLQMIFDECREVSGKWKVIGPLHGNIKLNCWKVEAPPYFIDNDMLSEVFEGDGIAGNGVFGRAMDCYDDLHLELRLSREIMIVFNKKLNDNLKFIAWVDDIEADAEVHLLSDHESSNLVLKRFVFPHQRVRDLEYIQYPVQGEIIEQMVNKYPTHLDISFHEYQDYSEKLAKILK